MANIKYIETTFDAIENTLEEFPWNVKKPQIIKAFEIKQSFNNPEEYELVGYGILQTNGEIAIVNEEGCGNTPEIDLDALNKFLNPKKKQYLVKTVNIDSGEVGASETGVCIIEADSEDEAYDICLKSLNEEDCEDFEDANDGPTLEDTKASWDICVHSLLEDVHTIYKQ